MVRKLEFGRSGGSTIVVVQHSAETFTTRKRPRSVAILAGSDEAIANSLMISLMVIVLHKLMDGSAKRMLSEQDETV